MVHPIFLPYGLAENGQLVHISEVESGQVALGCPFCGSVLIARKGKRLAHHFAHAKETCKEVTQGAYSKINLAIPFYTEFFGSLLSPSEKRAAQILYQYFELKPFYRKGKAGSAFQILYQGKIKRITKVWDQLVELKQIQPTGAMFQLNKDMQIGLTYKPIPEFAKIQAEKLHSYLTTLEADPSPYAALRIKVFDNMKTRLLDANLYCLHIPAFGQETDAWKIGITTRSAANRLKELLPVIHHHFGPERATATYITLELPSLGRLESYIKKRFSTSQLPFTYKGNRYTEFFTNPQLVSELQTLAHDIRLKKA